MTSANFSRPGAIDLSALKNAATQHSSGAGGGRSYVTEAADVTEFEGLLRKSLQFPIVVEFYSPRARGGEQLSQSLRELATEAAGRYLLVRVNCDTNTQVPQALGIQAVPTVVGVVGGQLAPLFQGTQEKSAIKGVIDQLLQAAVANGITGKAEPAGPADNDAGDDDAPKPPDPRFAAADAALERGDFAAARDEFDKVLKQNPGDAEATAGKAQSGLLARTSELDADQVMKEAMGRPDDIDANLAAADVELVSGRAAEAFARLNKLIRENTGDDRERVRTRLLELFETVGNSDPAVLKARRDLTRALF